MTTWNDKMRKDWLDRMDIQKEIDHNKNMIKINCVIAILSTLFFVLTIVLNHSWSKWILICIFVVMAFYAVTYAIELLKDVFLLEDIKFKEEGFEYEETTEERSDT